MESIVARLHNDYHQIKRNQIKRKEFYGNSYETDNQFKSDSVSNHVR